MPPPNSSNCRDDSMSTTLQISQDNGDDEILHNILHNNYKSQSLPSKYEYKFTDLIESSTVDLDSFNCTFKIKLATEKQ